MFLKSVSATDRDVIVKAEDRIQNDDSSRAYSYYYRSSFPSNADIGNVKAYMDNGRAVSVEASLKDNGHRAVSEQRQIPIQHVNNKHIKN